MLPAVIVAFGCFFYSEEIMLLLYENHIKESAEVFGILMFCFLSVSTTYIFGTLLTANGNLRELNIMASIGMVLNITLNIILIPKFYAFGSAISSFTTQLLTALFQVMIAQYVFRFKINYRFLAVFLLFLTGVFLLNIISLQFPADWKLKFIIMIALSIIWAFIIKFIDLKGLYRIMKQE